MSVTALNLGLEPGQRNLIKSLNFHQKSQAQERPMFRFRTFVPLAIVVFCILPALSQSQQNDITTIVTRQGNGLTDNSGHTWVSHEETLPSTPKEGLLKAAQNGSPEDQIQEEMKSQFVFTSIIPASGEIATRGSIVVLQKDGLPMCSFSNGRGLHYQAVRSTYKNGKISHGFENSSAPRFLNSRRLVQPRADCGVAPQRKFVAGERVSVTAAYFDTGEEGVIYGVVFHLYSDEYDGIRYHSELEFPFAKGSTPPADQFMKSVAEVLTVQPGGSSATGAALAHPGQGTPQEPTTGSVGQGRPPKVLHNQDLIEMSKAGLSDQAIVALLGKSKTDFDVSPAGLVQLRKAGVSNKVIEVMVGAPAAEDVRSPSNKSTTLTRGKAKGLIEQSSDWQPHQVCAVYPTSAELDDGLSKGLWATHTAAFNATALTLSIPTSCFTTYNYYYGYFVSGDGFTKKVLEITGIKDSPSMLGGSPDGKGKVALFTFSFDFAGCPDTVRDVFKTHAQSGEAIFQLYDDGWRLENIQYGKSIPNK
jgi:hypothetical protein